MDPRLGSFILQDWRISRDIITLRTLDVLCRKWKVSFSTFQYRASTVGGEMQMSAGCMEFLTAKTALCEAV